MNRRGFLGGLITSLAAPAIIRTPGLLMPIKSPLVDILSEWLSVNPASFVPFPPGMSATLRDIINSVSGGGPDHTILMSQQTYDILSAAFDEKPAYSVAA